MKKLFSWWKKKKKKFWVILLLVFCFLLLVRKNNVITWVGAVFEVHAQKREINALQERISELDKGIREMENDPDAAERYAREKLHFCADGEDVYLVEE